MTTWAFGSTASISACTSATGSSSSSSPPTPTTGATIWPRVSSGPGVPADRLATMTSPAPSPRAGAPPAGRARAGAWRTTGHQRRVSVAMPAPSTAPAATSAKVRSPRDTRADDTPTASGASAAPSSGDSMAAPVTNAVEDAAWADGKRRDQGRERGSRGLASAWATVEVAAAARIPRTPARRSGPRPLATRPPATAAQMRPRSAVRSRRWSQEDQAGESERGAATTGSTAGVTGCFRVSGRWRGAATAPRRGGRSARGGRPPGSAGVRPLPTTSPSAATSTGPSSSSMSSDRMALSW